MLVEEQVPIAHEMYAAVLNDPASKGPLLLFSAQGGMDIEEIAEKHPDALLRLPVDIRSGLDRKALERALPQPLPCDRAALVALLGRLYAAYAASDAELMEINPLVLTSGRPAVALDCKFAIDDSAIPRHAELAEIGHARQAHGARRRAARPWASSSSSSTAASACSPTAPA